ncbi:MAG TPA: flagellar basal-body rod protein FlgF [Beijerinckiaceae bacterium]|jgi:flagellar basal-body rod protein FlgF
MENALLIGLSRQKALGRELDVIANNMANVTTNGFKARSSRFQEFLSPSASADAFPRPDRRLSYVIDSGTPLDVGAGPVERTGNPLDVAVRGEGFFAVQTPQGERYTRDGSFEINAQGQLVTSAGQPVAGENGPITIGPQESGLAIAPDGTVSTDQGQRGRLRLVRFDNPQVLKNEGANLFSSPVAAQAAGPATRLLPGAVERSNVKPVVEMSRLIEVNRSYSSVAGMVSRLDELRRSAISRLADVPA